MTFSMQVKKINILTLPTQILIGLISILLFIPIYPVMPRSGLDPSWILAANEAVAQGMTFGRDILYTIGPLSAIWTQAYHPATFELTIIGGSIIAVSYAFLTYKISIVSHRAWIWMYATFFIFMMESRDALFLFYPLLVTFLIYRISLPFSNSDNIKLTRIETLFLTLSFLALGILPIIKLSFLPLTIVACIIGSILLWLSMQRFISALIITLPILSMILFWIIAGQDISAIPDYFINNASVISGFAPAMSIQYDFLTPALFAFSSLVVLYFFYRQLLIPLSINGFLLLTAITIFLFMSFKAGFVRHDVHALTASSGIVMAVLLLGSFPYIDYRKLSLPLLLSIFTWFIVHYHLSPSSFEYYKPLTTKLLAIAHDMITGNGPKLSLNDSYDAHLADIRKNHPIPKLMGTVDIYPWEQATVIASSNKWSPRPALQSFTAYTPSLATVNLRHLTSLEAPDNIVFAVNTIDGRYPSMDDGTSWPTLFSHYELSQVIDKQLILRKRDLPVPKQVMSVIFAKRAQLGEIINMEMQHGVIYAEIEITPSLLGRAASTMYKPTALKITVELSNGQTQNGRFISGEAVTGFILSPYVANTSDFAKILQGSEAMNKLPVVNKLKIEETPFSIGMWNHYYSIKLYRLANESNTVKLLTK